MTAAKHTLRNGMFDASAGTGKTHQVTGLYTAMILGKPYPESEKPEKRVFEGDALDCSQILMLTFARNAAAEMRTRISERIEDELTNAESADKPKHWSLLRSLAGANISTIHAFAQRLLAGHAILAGESPSLSVLDDTMSEELFLDSIEQELLKVLDGIGAQSKTMSMLCRAHGLTGAFGATGVVDMIKQIIRDARARGLELDRMDIDDMLDRPIAPMRSQLEAIFNIVQPPIQKHLDSGRASKNGEILIESLRTELADLRSNSSSERVAAAAGRVCDAISRRWPDDHKPLINAEVDKLVRINGYLQFAEAKEHLRHFLELAASCIARFQARKRELGALDFDDLILKVLDVVKKHPAALSSAGSGGGFKVIIVDEAQDNSRVQNELVEQLANACGASVVLCGDWKQSIHTWRAADPGGMRKLMEKLDDTIPMPLQVSYRSQKGLIDWINVVSRRDLALGADYTAGEELKPRPLAEKTSGPNVELLMAPWETNGDLTETLELGKDNEPKLRFKITGKDLKELAEDTDTDEWTDHYNSYDSKRSLEARAVARRIKLLCEPEADPEWRPGWMWDDLAKEWVPGDGRSYNYRDVLILLRTSTNQDMYEMALREAGIRYTTDGKGRGFFFRQEVLDICSLVNWLAWPHDDLSLVALIRSPFAALSDTAVAVIAAGHKRRGKAIRDAICAEGEAAESTAQTLLSMGLKDDATAYREIASRFSRLRKLAGRLSAVELIREAIQLTGYDAALSGQFHGVQKLANMRKLLSLIHDIERRENLDLQALAGWLSNQAGTTKAPDAVVFDPEDDAVRISTVHAAKGLTSPVVVIPDLRRSSLNKKSWCLLEDTPDGKTRAAATLKQCSRNGTAEKIPTCNREAAEDAESKREELEVKRLFYVAITRPRDLLILSGENANSKRGSSWRTWVNDYIESRLDANLDSLMRIRTYGEVESAYHPFAVAVAAIQPPTEAEINAAVGLVKPPQLDSRYRMPVTSLMNVPIAASAEEGDIQSAWHEYCRTSLANDTSAWMQARVETDGEAGTSVDYAALGTIGHNVLEHFDFSDNSNVESRVCDELAKYNSPGLQQRVCAAAEFLCGELADAEHVIRELPFCAKFEHDGRTCFVDGKIDLLYFKNDTWHITDYKFTNANADGLLKKYSMQLLVYRDAIAKIDCGLEGVGADQPTVMTLLGVMDDGVVAAIVNSDVSTESVAERVVSAARIACDGMKVAK